MAYTDTASAQSGVIYDVAENARLNDFANQFNDLTQKADNTDTKKKDTIRYIIIGFGAVLVLALLRIAVKRK